MELAHATCNAVAGNGMAPNRHTGYGTESPLSLLDTRAPALLLRHANEIHVLPKHTRAPRDEPLVSEKDVGSKWVGIGRLLFGPGPGTNSTALPCSALLPQPRDEAPEVASGELQGCGVDLVVDHRLTTPKPKAALSMAGAAVKRP